MMPTRHVFLFYSGNMSDDALYALFKNEIMFMGGKYRALFPLMNCVVQTLALLCTAITCVDKKEGLKILNALDALSEVCSQDDGHAASEYCVRHQARVRAICQPAFDTFREDFLQTMKQFRDTEWKNPPPGIPTAFYMAYRLIRVDTLGCAAFETMSLALLDVTSFGGYDAWYPWICGAIQCATCKYAGGGGDANRSLSLCHKCENTFYCSLKCKKKHRAVHSKYCQWASETSKYVRCSTISVDIDGGNIVKHHQ
jgi:hypothetical protein